MDDFNKWRESLPNELNNWYKVVSIVDKDNDGYLLIREYEII